MKQLIIYFTLILGLISCNYNKKEMTQTEFERLFTHDSIQQISLYTNDQVAKIRIKPFHENDRVYILPIKSVESFETSIDKLQRTLKAQNIRSIYSMTKSSGPKWYEYLLFGYPIFLLCSLILFLFTAIDVLKNRFESATDKLIWFLVVLIPLIGPILYIFIGGKQRLAK